MILPVANFSISPTQGIAPLTVQFTDLSQNAESRSWDFGDGTNSTEQNPTHTYSTVGTYTVKLTVSNKNDTDLKVATITVQEYKVLPVADFNANPTSGYCSSFRAVYGQLLKMQLHGTGILETELLQLSRVQLIPTLQQEPILLTL